jgi:hypothetical protein
MRKVSSVRPLSLCILATFSSLASACHEGKRNRLDAGIDPISELCKKEPFASTEECKGRILVSGQLNTCPKISLEASPLQVQLDKSVMISGVINDPEGGSVEQEWSAEPDGTFDLSSSPVVFYLCESIGRKTLTLIASDEQGCETSEVFEVSCMDVAAFEQAGTDPLPQAP